MTVATGEGLSKRACSTSDWALSRIVGSLSPGSVRATSEGQRIVPVLWNSHGLATERVDRPLFRRFNIPITESRRIRVKQTHRCLLGDDKARITDQNRVRFALRTCSPSDLYPRANPEIPEHVTSSLPRRFHVSTR